MKHAENPRELVCIGYAYGAAPVAIVTASLAGAGIPLFRQDYHMGHVAQHLSIAMGGMRLQVPAAHGDEARAFIAAQPELICRPLRWRIKLVLLVMVLGLGGAAASISAFFPVVSMRSNEPESGGEGPEKKARAG